MKGTVKFFDEDKGFGFIDPQNGGASLFVHFTSIISESFKTLSKGQQVTFDIVPTEKGLAACNVSVIQPVT